ncbi:MAG: N,N-dimethylformamidase beta subunit family domain-containing protein, partial [Ktedonobacteraceae bacterium]
MKQGTYAYFLRKLLAPGRRSLRLLLVSGMIAILLQVISTSSFTPGLPRVVHAASSNPIVLENEQQGSTGWEFDNYNKETHHEIEGYASLTSVNQGGQISLMVSLSAAAQYTMDIYRMGYYPHGTNPDNSPCSPCGGRLMLHIGPLNGSTQANCPTNTNNTSINFGLIECNWTPSYTLTVPTNWTTGNYLVKLIRLDDKLENYITFVVRSDGVAADIVYSMDVTTWAAYNMWGGAGNSNVGYDLYGEFNDVNYNVISNNRAYTVSFDRPYLDQGSLDGAGNFMLWDYPMVRWMESQGYNVTYVTDVDLENNPNLMNGRKVFMNAGHDEYYSDNMRGNLQKFISNGINVAFFSADNIGNRIVWGNDGSGQQYRRVTCDKGAFPGSTTIAWRALTPPQPENAVVGVMQNGVAASEPFLVYDASSWIYAGTGLVNYNGTVKTSGPGQNAIAGLIGYEFDERAVNAPDLSAYVSYEPPGLIQVGHSYVPPGDNGVAAYADTTLYSAPSGAMVFASGTIQWSWGVDNGFNDGFCSCNTGMANTVSQQITANILNRFIGNSSPTPEVSLNPTSLDFGTVQVGTPSSPQTVTVTNSGSASLTISNIAISGSNASDFAQTNTCTSAIAPGANCTISVTFTPGASGSRSGTLTLTDNAPDSPQTVALTGAGGTATPDISFNPTDLGFGNQNVGTTSTAQTDTVTNSGSASLTISNIAISGSNASDFAQTNTCTSPLAQGANCTISVTFTPGANGSRSASVTVTDNAPNSPQSIPLSGTGVTPAPAITITPSSLSFGNQNVGSTSSAQPLTVTSSGTATLTISNIAISGTNASDFAQTNTCTAPLAPEATCTINVTFTPGASGSRSGTVTITDNAPDSPQSAPLTGTGVVQGTYFSDGFETGNFSKWSFSNSDSTGKATVQSAVVNSGQYAAQFTNASGQYAYIYTALPGGPEAQTYTRFYFRFTSMAGGTELAMGINNNGGNVWEVDYDANLKGLDIYFWDSTGNLHSLSTSANALSANTWYSIEIEDQETSSGVGQVWLNGTSIGTVNGNFSTA